MDGAPGWYGKLPTLGDFASRRLDGGFIEPWDRWLGEGLAAHRERLGDAWLDAYLEGPVWRFALMPGVLPHEGRECGWAGVLMPSVDRVGRYFPLTIAAPLPSLPGSAAAVEALLVWLHKLEDVAVDALQDDWSVDELERVLGELPAPLADAASAHQQLDTARELLAQAVAAGGGIVDLGGLRRRSDLAALMVSALGGVGPVPEVPHGMAFWLADSANAAKLAVSRGLPPVDDFVRMFPPAVRGEALDTGL